MNTDQLANSPDPFFAVNAVHHRNDDSFRADAVANVPDSVIKMLVFNGNNDKIDRSGVVFRAEDRNIYRVCR